MGSPRSHHRRLAGAAVVLVSVAACSAADDSESAATIAAAGGAATTAGAAQPASREADGQSTSTGLIAPAAPAAGQQLAIEARAAVQAADVRAAVDRLTMMVETRGGRVASADVDYDPRPADPSTGQPDTVDDSRATLVLSIPPDELAAMSGALAELGVVTSFDQLAEDVTEQLTDLDIRIGNTRASVERVRALLAEAVDIEGIVRLETELTTRETALEQLLASQRQLDERVAMSTLTVEITTTPPPTDTTTSDDDDPSVLDALAGGWSAFVTGLHGIALAAAAVAPFAAAAALLALVGLAIRRVILRRRPPAQPTVAP